MLLKSTIYKKKKELLVSYFWVQKKVSLLFLLSVLQRVCRSLQCANSVLTFLDYPAAADATFGTQCGLQGCICVRSDAAHGACWWPEMHSTREEEEEFTSFMYMVDTVTAHLHANK